MKLSKLAALMTAEGYESLDDLLKDAGADYRGGGCVGICTNPGCDYTTQDIEPDQQQGCCECCGTQSVSSALVLAGMI